ncbi:hypothetical protein F5B21DRAFT_33161 [Xylaria acuta]|nr:hypothetical protein F5B21DRAFT_33161 [Xylaria acuta]
MPDLNSIPSNPHGRPVAVNRRRSLSTTNALLHGATPQPLLPPISPQLLASTGSSQLPVSAVSSPFALPDFTPSASSCVNILPSNQPAFQERSSPWLPSPSFAPATRMPPPVVAGPPVIPGPPPARGQDNTGVGAGPGPLRHPRPLTAAELHSQLEQEQELIVNRLSRDLTLLRRAQNSSALSNASSTSASTSAAVDPLYSSSFTDSHLLSGPGFPVPTSRRHHRTSSSASSRSLSLLNHQGSSISTATVSGSHSGSAAILEAARNPRGAAGMSRQNSTTSHRSSSRNRSPQSHMGSSGPLPSSHSQPHGFPDPAPGYFNRDRASSNASIAATPGSDLSPGLLPATLRYEETIHYRNELEVAKRENEALKKRVKALEKKLRERKETDSESSRPRTESATESVGGTTGARGVVGGDARISIYLTDEHRSTDPASMAVGVVNTELRVGESAASAGTESSPPNPPTTSYLP